MNSKQLHTLRKLIAEWASELGFQSVGVTDTELGEHEQHLKDWLQQSYNGSMSYMASHGEKRSRPATLVPDTLRLISVRLDYVAGDENAVALLEQSNKAYIARYALGRDYHKMMRKRLAKLADKIAKHCEEHYQFRAFVDSAPVLERAIAEKSGAGWIGKNTMLINAKAGSWFFLGELYTDLNLPVDPPQETGHCGSCTACMDICPTNAFVEPYVLDARRCISYLTIESKEAIPVELRPLMGNRIYGCDDCQLFCPWNKFAETSNEPDFQPRHHLDNCELLELFGWNEEQFLSNTEGSAIRRAGFDSWQRNIAVALGNANYSSEIVQALIERIAGCSELVREHCQWALEQQQIKKKTLLIP